MILQRLHNKVLTLQLKNKQKQPPDGAIRTGCGAAHKRNVTRCRTGSLQKVTFCIVKGGLSACKTWPFGS